MGLSLQCLPVQPLLSKSPAGLNVKFYSLKFETSHIYFAQAQSGLVVAPGTGFSLDCQSQSYIMASDQSTNLSWCQAAIYDP
jgi:hypothetical protein